MMNSDRNAQSQNVNLRLPKNQSFMKKFVDMKPASQQALLGTQGTVPENKRGCIDK